MAGGKNSLTDLVAIAYEASLDPALWPRVAAEASSRIDAPFVRLGVVEREGCTRVLDVTSRYLNEAQFGLANYLTPHTNPGLAFCAFTPSATVETRDKFVPDRDLERSSFYQDLMRPLDLWHVAIINAHSDTSILAPMGFLRTRSQHPFGEDDLEELRAFAPHLNRALRVYLRLRDLEARAEALSDANEHALVAVVMTDASGRVAEANRLARKILSEADGLSIRDGSLRATGGADNACLARLVREAAGFAPDRPKASGVMCVARPSCRRPLALVVSPTRNAASPFGGSHAVCISFADPERAPEADAKLLARLYGFTPREASVAALLLAGRSPSAAADELAMTENTVRTHIRHMFDKTRVERLADLVRLLMQGPAVRGRWP